MSDLVRNMCDVLEKARRDVAAGRQERLAAARKNVVETARSWHNIGDENPTQVIADLDAAVTALAKLEQEPPDIPDEVILKIFAEVLAEASLPTVDVRSDPIWPGLKGEGLGRTGTVWSTAYRAAIGRGLSYDDARRVAYTAEAAYLWRAMVESVPDDTDYPGGWVLMGSASVPRAALGALADPYDGGGK